MRKGAPGFTLLELLVALLVTGFVVTAAYAAFVVVTDTWERSRAAREPAMATAAVRDIVAGWLSAATLNEAAGPFRGVGRGVGALQQDELTFAIQDGGPLRPGPHRVRLWVVNDLTAERQGLLAELTPIRGQALAAPETLSIAPAVTGLALRYRVMVDGRERWLEEWESEGQLPRAVELQMKRLVRTRLGAAPEPGLPPLLDLPLLVPIALELW